MSVNFKRAGKRRKGRRKRNERKAERDAPFFNLWWRGWGSGCVKMVKKEIKKEVEKLCVDLERALSRNDFEDARKQLSVIEETVGEIHIDIEKVEKEYLEPERSITIEMKGMDEKAYNRLRERLKCPAFKLISTIPECLRTLIFGIPCGLIITDDEGTNIRRQEGW